MGFANYQREIGLWQGRPARGTFPGFKLARLAAVRACEGHLAIDAGMITNGIESPFVVPGRDQYADDAELTQVHREDPVALRIDPRVNALCLEILPYQLRLDFGGGSVKLCPPLCDPYASVVGAEVCVAVAVMAFVADGLATYHTSTLGWSIGVLGAGGLDAKLSARRAGVAPAVFFFTSRALENRVVICAAVGTGVHRARNLGIAGGTVRHLVDWQGEITPFRNVGKRKKCALDVRKGGLLWPPFRISSTRLSDQPTSS